MVTAVALATAKELIVKLSTPLFELICKEKHDEKLRAKRINKATKNFYQTIYFSGMITYGYLTLRDTPWLPWFLGGRAGGSITNALVDMPFTKAEAGT